MDALSAIVASIAAATSAASKDIASQAVRDAYAALKAVIGQRFRRKAAVEAVEEAPQSPSARDALGGALRETGAETDPEILRLAEALAAALSELSEQELQRAGVKIGSVRGYRDAIVRDVSGGRISIKEVTAETGDAVVERLHAEGKLPKGP